MRNAGIFLNRKSIFCFILCIFVVILMTSCGNIESTTVNEDNYDSHSKYTAYVINNLDYTYLDEEKQSGCIEIIGLKDKSVEEKINKKIYEKYYEVLNGDIPKYRGIKAKFGNNPEIEEGDYAGSVDCYIAGNYNNLLSVVVTKSVCYKTLKGENESEYVIQEEPLNFDLNTGEEIKLSDIFNDKSEGISALSEKIYNKIIEKDMQNEYADSKDYSGNQLTLIGKYSGIDENQKFYFDYEPKILLIFDYETPEYYTGYNGFQSANMVISLSSDMVILDKWYDDNSTLFDSDEPVSKAFISESSEERDYYAAQKQLLNEDEEDSNFYANISTSISKSLSEDMKKTILDDENIDMNIDNYAKELKPYADEAIKKSGEENSYCFGSKGLNIFRMGKYYNLCFSEYKSAGCNDNNSEFVDSVLEEINYIYRVYKEGSSKPLEIKNLFDEDVDYEDILVDCFCKELQSMLEGNGNDSYYYDFGFGKNADRDRKYAKLLIENISGFQLENQFLSFDYKNLKDTTELMKKTYGDEFENLPMADNAYFLVSTLFYKDIGDENLVIFD